MSDLSYRTHIHKVLNQVHHDTHITFEAVEYINTLLLSVLDLLTYNCILFIQNSKKRTISSRHVQSAVMSILQGEMRINAVSEGTRALGKCVSLSEKRKQADLRFPATSTGVYMRKEALKLLSDGVRISACAPSYVAAVLEYIAAEILEISGDICRTNKRKRISEEHVKLAIENDEELSKVNCLAQK